MPALVVVERGKPRRAAQLTGLRRRCLLRRRRPLWRRGLLRSRLRSRCLLRRPLRGCLRAPLSVKLSGTPLIIDCLSGKHRVPVQYLMLTNTNRRKVLPPGTSRRAVCTQRNVFTLKECRSPGGTERDAVHTRCGSIEKVSVKPLTPHRPKKEKKRS